MGADEERRSLELKKPNMPAEKKTQMRIAQSGGVERLLAWGGALAFACLLAASIFKRNKCRSADKSQDGGSNLASGGLRENLGCENEAEKMKELRFLPESLSTCTRTSSSVQRFMKEKEKGKELLKVFEEESSDSENFKEDKSMLKVDQSSDDETAGLPEWPNRSSKKVDGTTSLPGNLPKKSIGGDDKIIEIIIT